ncbi:MAG: hypothetical protein WCR51_04960 [Planctomycetia bacterium]
MTATSRHAIAWFACVVGGLAAEIGVFGAEPDPVAQTRFMRVHVPRDGLADVPLGDERYVPMPRDAFEAAVTRSTGAAGAASSPDSRRADAARYEARITAAGVLEGRVAFDIGPVDGVGASDMLPLGMLSVTACTATTAEGVGVASVFGLGDGTSAVATAGAGEYVAEWTAGLPRATNDGRLHAMPLLPAVRSSIRLQLPRGRRPLLVGHDLSPTRDGTAWLIEAGARPRVEFYVVDEQPLQPAVSSWSRLAIAGREAAVDVSMRPVTIWNGERATFDKDPALVVADVSLAAGDRRAVAWFEAEDRRSITCLVPAEAMGTRTPIVIRAVGPLPDGLARPLPMLRPPVRLWAGGGAVIEVDPAWTLAAIELTQCLAITAEASASWPLPESVRTQADEVGGGFGPPARVHLEHQGPGAEVRAAVVPRTGRIDVHRVTVVDFAPGVVVGVATCDIGVRRGEAFDLTGLIAPGWFIDTVDAVGWSQSPLWGEPASISEARTGEPLEWKVVRDARGDVLRIGLTAAATPGRRLRLRISGHRAGAAAGAAFSAGEIDMVRLVGETEGVAAIGFKTSAEQAVELVGADAGAVDPRLAPLVDEPAVRAWATVGGRSSAWEVKLVQRRPPLDVQAQVRLTVRDDRLSQSFTFECRPDASDLDSLVVQFSEPMDDLLEWSLLAPASGSMVARRLESADDSWVVEFTPPVREAVTIRAARTVPFEAALPIPLAWVDGAPRQVGEVIVRDAGRRRPTIDNRRLAELPAGPDAAGEWPTIIGEFSFTGGRAAAGPAAAELVPGKRDDGAARAWAWRETTSCWCHASGRTEFETVFEIESHGRSGVVLGLPAGRRLEGIEIDGMPAAVVPEENVTAIPVELPAGRPSFALVVRSSAETAAWGAWRVEPAGVAIDLPVLDRICRVALPPELEIGAVSAAWRGVGQAAGGVAERLAGLRGASVAPSSRGSGDGHRGPTGEAYHVREFVPADGRGDGGAVVVVRRRWITGAAVLVGSCIGGVVLAGARRRPWLAPVACVIAGVAALWCPAPGDLVARAAWWAAIAAMLLVIRRPAASGMLLALACLVSAPVSTAAAADALPVFITPLDDGEMALVPEPLYRLLARSGADRAGAIRVVSCQLLVPEVRAAGRNAERLLLRIDVDAPAAGVLDLGRQDAPDGWVIDSAQIDGEAATVTGAPVRYDLVVPTAGRHRVEIEVRPRIEQAGDVVVLTARLPPAPTATVEFAVSAGLGPRGLRCEAAPPDGPFAEAPSVWSVDSERFVSDVPQAARVRLVRPLADGVSLAVEPPVVESRNTVFWDLDSCRVAASFVIDPGRDIVAPCIVRADRGLARVEPADGALDVVQLPGNRYLVHAVRPTAGPWRFEMTFRRPLPSPVGIFAVPGAWIEGAAADVRTTTLEPAIDLAVQVDAPAPLVMLAPEERGGPAWRCDVRPPDGQARDDRGAAASTEWSAGEPQARITVERRRQDIRGTQDARIRFTADRTFVVLDARFDASSTPLVSLPIELPSDCVVESVSLFDNGLQPPDPADRGPLDTSWRRATPEQGVLTMQRPVAGRFRLEVVAHVPRPPAATGRVPVVRALLPAAPVVAAWNESLDATGPERSWELRSDDRPPLYTLRAAVVPEPVETAPAEQPAPQQAAAAEPRVELAEVDVTFEDRGRAWGRARFDVVTRDRRLRLGLPRGMRLFEVFVDGLPTLPSTPAPGSAPSSGDVGERWDITLHDTSWPRSIEVVYAGTVGGALDEDGPLAIAPPTLVGLPCMRRLWTLQAPRGAVVHVAEPGRPLDAAAVREERAAALAALRTDFERAIEVSSAVERERLRAVVEMRERRLDDVDRTSGASAGAVVHVAAAPIDAPLTVRIARRRDPSLVARAWATLALLASGGTAWIITRRAAAWKQAGPSEQITGGVARVLERAVEASAGMDAEAQRTRSERRPGGPQ